MRLAGLLLLLVSPLAGAQPDPATVGSLVNEGQRQAYDSAENQSGRDLTSEDVDVHVLVDVRDAQFDMTGVLLGGGSVETSIAIDAELAIRAVNASRVEQAMDEYNGNANASVSELTGINTSRSALTADELRTAGGGVVLEAFQAYQEDLTRDYLAEMLPQLTLLSLSFEWENTRPAQEGENETDSEPREPPLVLETRARMEYLDRYSLVDLLETDGNTSEAKTPEERLQESLLENQTVPLREQSAFQVLGIAQLVDLRLPPGWLLNLTVEMPKGYTIASATEALHVHEDRRTASYYVDGTGRQTVLASSGVVELSDRSLVTTTVAGLALALGLVLRVPAEFLGKRWAGSTAGED